MAYAPYSESRVGAVVVTSAGQLFSGCNVENSSYGMTSCAEDVAILRMIASTDAKIATDRSIAAVYIWSSGDVPAPPCGPSLQMIAEFAAPGCIVQSYTGDGPLGRVETWSLRDLLPHPFRIEPEAQPEVREDVTSDASGQQRRDIFSAILKGVLEDEPPLLLFETDHFAKVTIVGEWKIRQKGDSTDLEADFNISDWMYRLEDVRLSCPSVMSEDIHLPSPYLITPGSGPVLTIGGILKLTT